MPTRPPASAPPAERTFANQASKRVLHSISLCPIVRSSYEWPSASIPPPVRVRADVAGPHAAADARGGSGQPFDEEREERLVEQMRAWANARSVDRTAKDRRPDVAPSTHAPLVP